MITYEQHQALSFLYQVVKNKKFSVTKLQLLLSKKYSKNILSQLANQDLIEKTTKSVALTKKGLEIGYQSLRTFAVLNIFCQDILGLSKKETEEHIKGIFYSINNYLLEKYCTMIGHALVHRIPVGACCKRAELETSERVIPLSKLPLHTEATVLFIKTKEYTPIQKLFELGIYPGQSIKIQQLYPIYIVQTEHGEIALENQIANNIFVKK